MTPHLPRFAGLSPGRVLIRTVSGLAFALTLAFMPMRVAHATEANDAQILSLKTLLGFDRLLAQAVKLSVRDEKAFAGIDEKKQVCVEGLVAPLVDAHLAQALRSLFNDGETIDQWIAFSKTPVGAKLLASMRDDMFVSALGEAPQVEKFNPDTVSDEERADLIAFFTSPAATVLQKNFPDMALPEGELQAAAERALVECGLEKADMGVKKP